MTFKTVLSILPFLTDTLSPYSWRLSDWPSLAVPSSPAVNCTNALSCYALLTIAATSHSIFSPFRCLSAPYFPISSRASGTSTIDLLSYQRWVWILAGSISPFSRNLASISRNLRSSLRGRWSLPVFFRRGLSSLLYWLAFPSLSFMITCIFPLWFIVVSRALTFLCWVASSSAHNFPQATCIWNLLRQFWLL